MKGRKVATKRAHDDDGNAMERRRNSKGRPVDDETEVDGDASDAADHGAMPVLGMTHVDSGDSIDDDNDDADEDEGEDEEEEEQESASANEGKDGEEEEEDDDEDNEERALMKVLTSSTQIKQISKALAGCLRLAFSGSGNTRTHPRSRANFTSTSTAEAVVDGSSPSPSPSTLHTGIDSRMLYLPSTKWFPGSKSLITVVEHNDTPTTMFADAATSSSLSSSAGATTEAELDRLERIMKKNKLAGIEKLTRVEKPASTSLQKKLVRAQRTENAGNGWFNMSRPEMTDELKQELQVLQLRGYVDPKRFYKKSSQSKMPEYFEVGHVVTGAADYYSASRTTKKQQKLGFVDELLQDQEYRKYAKRKYREIQEKHSGRGGRKKKRAKR
jgi:hypothetical protein